ncbi:hypothetical protein Tco_0919545 [Tanacetum coccineum]
MPEALVPHSGTDRQQSMRNGERLGDRVEISLAITSKEDMTVKKSFTEKPNASNSTLQLLSLFPDSGYLEPSAEYPLLSWTYEPVDSPVGLAPNQGCWARKAACWAAKLV